jgi:hypothetical protein
VLYTLQEKLYAVTSSRATIDATLGVLEKHNVYFPIRNFPKAIRINPFTGDLLTGHVIGKVMFSRKRCSSSRGPSQARSGSCG